jgi:predicted Ser/Thr protein kinase
MAEKTTENLSPSKKAARRVGSDLTEKWRIDRVLGVGGMGAVFAATHKNNGTRAALKVLHAEYAAASDVRERFLREGRIANKVDHIARVAVVDDGVSDLGEPFLVMELLEGMTLGELLKRSGGRVPLEKLLGVFDPVLDLLGKCHELEIIHRDIKPANIFLTKQGSIRVLDFGVARMREVERGIEATRAGIALGTASFIAPEQALGMDKIDGRADLFSVGACIYTGITGERLHAGKSEAEEFVMAATQAAPSIARKATELPVEVVAFVDRALAFDRNDRFQSAGDMRSSLMRLSSGLRSGAIKSQRRGATGVVVKGNDAIDDGPELTEHQAREQRERLVGIFRQLATTLASVRQYGLSHPQTTKALATSFADVGTALAASPHSVRWDVETGAFTFEREVVWAPDRVPFDRIPHQLFADGIRKVQLKPGLTEEELRDVVALLLRDVSTMFDADDSVTALWDRRFEHVAYLAVDSFSEGESLEPDHVANWHELADQTLELAKLDKDFDEAGLEEQALEQNLVTWLGEAGESAMSLALDPMTRATMGTQLAQPPERWLASYVDAFIPAFEDARSRGDAEIVERAMKGWVDDQLSLSAADKVFEFHELLAHGFKEHYDPRDAEEREVEAAQTLFSIEVLRSLMMDMAAERKGAWAGDGNAPPKALVSSLGRALSLLGSSAVFGLACEVLDNATYAPLCAVLTSYIGAWAAKEEPMVQASLARCGPNLAAQLLDLCIEQRLSVATMMETALQNPNTDVKLAALARMGETVSDRAKEELARLLDAPEREVRAKTLASIERLGVVAAGPALVRKIQAEAFHDLHVDERRLMLTTVCHLRPARGEAVAIELLSKRRLLSNEATEATRTLAAEVLADFESDETKEALQTVAKQRWGSSAALREAATKALVAVEARRAKKQPQTAAAGKS